MYRQHRLTFVTGAIILSANLIGGCSQKPSEAMQAPPIPEVGIVTLQTQTLPITTELAGRTSAYLVAEVRPQVGGIIQQRLFREGSNVKAKETLYQIDPAPYQAALDSAKAAQSKAEANLEVAKLKADRYKELVAIHAVSSQDNDNAIASVKQGEADVASAKAAVETARINLDYTKVSSPISGRIGKSSVTPGALVTANQALALSTVQQLDPIYVDVTQSNTDLMRLKRDLASGELKSAGANQAKVALLLEDGSEYPQTGTLQFSDVTVDPGTGAITIRAVFPNPKNDLLPGMYVRAILSEAVNNEAILVPQQGVTRNNKGAPVTLLLGADNKVELREITTSRTVGDKWLVNSGLKAGDRVIVEGLQRVKPGMEAKVAAAPAQNSMQGMDIMSGMSGISVHSSKNSNKLPKALKEEPSQQPGATGAEGEQKPAAPPATGKN